MNDHSANISSYRGAFRIDAAHACLPGHFPGQPLVPAVVMLEHVALQLKAWRNARLARVIEAKFVAPLLPEQEAQITLEAQGTRIRFQIEREQQVLARGVIEGVSA